jgi:mono/diheme cytochrome c family protein
VIDTTSRRALAPLVLPDGSGLLQGVAVSPDGRYAAVTHNLARYHLPTTQVERGWMNTAALTLIDVPKLAVVNTVLLDNAESGAANPWAVAWSPDGSQLLVTHAGTHELSVIAFPALVAKLDGLPDSLPAGRRPDPGRTSNIKADVPNDLVFVVGLRQRIKLAVNGPRALAITGSTAWVSGYFSDSVDMIDFRAPNPRPVSLPLGPPGPMSAARRGESLFNDATLCFQTWQSCASCHSHDARVDGLNWDLLNDGIGNPKNAKSLLWAHRTPPAMSTGVRATAEVAVRAGIRHSLFAVLPEEIPEAIDAYLKSLAPAPSPHLENGVLSRSAQRGKRIFEDPKVGCATCHPPPLFTDLQKYDVGTRRPMDGAGTNFDTPTLVELWRTAPYLHDGSARTLRDVLILHNPRDKHGATSHLSQQQIDDLTAYVLSL